MHGSLKIRDLIYTKRKVRAKCFQFFLKTERSVRQTCAQQKEREEKERKEERINKEGKKVKKEQKKVRKKKEKERKEIPTCQWNVAGSTMVISDNRFRVCPKGSGEHPLFPEMTTRRHSEDDEDKKEHAHRKPAEVRKRNESK